MDRSGRAGVVGVVGVDERWRGRGLPSSLGGGMRGGLSRGFLKAFIILDEEAGYKTKKHGPEKESFSPEDHF